MDDVEMAERPLALFRVRVAQALLVASVLTLAVLSVPAILDSDEPLVKLAAVVPLVLSGVLVVLLAWRFPTQTMIRLTFLSLAAMVTVVNVFWGGETLAGLGGFTVLILMAGFLLGKRAALVTAVYSALVATVTISGVFATLPEPLESIQGRFVDSAPILRIVLEVMYYAVATLIMWVFVTWIEHSWDSTRLREHRRGPLDESTKPRAGALVAHESDDQLVPHVERGDGQTTRSDDVAPAVSSRLGPSHFDRACPGRSAHQKICRTNPIPFEVS